MPKRRWINAYKLLEIELTIKEWLVEYFFFVAILLVAALVVFGGIGGGTWFFILLGFSVLICIFVSFGGMMSWYFGIKQFLTKARQKQR